jgi:hypothetical protein
LPEKSELWEAAAASRLEPQVERSAAAPAKERSLNLETLQRQRSREKLWGPVRLNLQAASRHRHLSYIFP